MTDIVTIFKNAVRGANVMTPELIRYAETPNHIIELTTGRGLNNDQIYGVTVVNKHTRQCAIELDDMFYSREFAEAYIADIR